MKKAEKVDKKELKADNGAIEADAKEADKAEKPRLTAPAVLTTPAV